MAELEKIDRNGIEGYAFYCKGCKTNHVFYTKNGSGPTWEFNGDLENPTFSPSLLVTFYDGKTCHLFLKGGEIQYLNDCFHDLAGQTIKLKEV